MKQAHGNAVPVCKHSQQDVLRACLRDLHLLRELACLAQHHLRPRGKSGQILGDGSSLRCDQAVNDVFKLLGNNPAFRQDAGCRPLFRLQKSDQEMLRAYINLSVIYGSSSGQFEGLLCRFGVLIIHPLLLPSID